VTHSSAVCVVRFQLQHPRRTQQVFAALTNAATTPANALFSIRRPVSSISCQRLVLIYKWRFFWKQYNGLQRGLAPPSGATLPVNVSPC